MSSPTDRDGRREQVILAAVDLSDEARSRLAGAGRLVELGSGGLSRVDPSDLSDAVAILVNSKSQVGEAVIAGAPALRIVATQSIGFDHIDIEAAARAGVEVSHAPNRRDALAAIVMAHLLMLSRNLERAVTQVREGLWSAGITGRDLDGTVLFLVGFGGTARVVAQKALAFDMRVIAYDVRPQSDVPTGVRIVATMEEGLAEADWVSLHVDLNPHTHHLFGAAQFTQMKPTAYVINTSRGPVVDQVALAEALQRGVIAGAGLDVLETEPPRPDDPILGAPNVLITPHIGFATRDIQRDMQNCAVATLLARVADEPDPYVLPSTARTESAAR